MAIFTIDLNLNQEQTHMVQDLFKYGILILIFHSLVYVANFKKGNNIFGITGKFLNEDFLGFLLLVLVTITSYYLIILELIELK